MPPKTINVKATGSKSGTELVANVVNRLEIWLNKMINKLFWEAVFVSMLKK